MLDDLHTGGPVHRGGGGTRIGRTGHEFRPDAAGHVGTGQRRCLSAHFREPEREIEVVDRDIPVRMRDQQPRPDHLRIIAGHVRDREIEGPAGGEPSGQSPALDAGDALAHAIDGADRVSRGQQVRVHPGEVRRIEPFGEQLHERGSAARHQRQGFRVGRDRIHEVHERAAGRQTGFIGHRMRGLDHRDRPSGIEPITCVAMLRDDEGALDSGPEHIERARHHGRRRLAHREGEARREAPFSGQPAAHALAASGGIERGAESVEQKAPRVRYCLHGKPAIRRTRSGSVVGSRPDCRGQDPRPGQAFTGSIPITPPLSVSRRWRRPAASACPSPAHRAHERGRRGYPRTHRARPPPGSTIPRFPPPRAAPA